MIKVALCLAGLGGAVYFGLTVIARAAGLGV
jgi:hypothetical protein